MTLLGVDLSHHQEDRARVDFTAVRRAGFRFAILKATEGSTYVDPAFAGMRARARAAGVVTGAYHFARAGNATAEADKFCRTVGALNPGELVVLDWEVAAPDPVGWSLVWLRTVRDRLGVKPLIYMNQHVRDSYDWSPVVVGDFGLWLAKYDFNQSQPPGGRWPTVAMKQFTDAGTVPGVAGGVDVNVFYGDEAALARYGKPGQAPAPTPIPAPAQEDDMRLNAYRADGKTVFAGGPGIWKWVPNNTVLSALQKSGTLGPVADVSPADLEAIREFWVDAVVEVRNAVWNTPLGDDGNITNGAPWASSRLAGVDSKSGQALAALDRLKPSA